MTEFTVAVRATNDSHVIDFDRLPATSRDFIIAYGLKQLLNDAHVSEKDVGAKRGLIEKKLDKLWNGTLGIREAREATDPVYAEAIRMAKAAYKAAKKEPTEDQLDEYARNEKVLAVAKESVARKAAERAAKKAALAALPTV